MTNGREPVALVRDTGGDRERIFDAFSRWGYLAANLDPLGVKSGQDYGQVKGNVVEDFTFQGEGEDS